MSSEWSDLLTEAARRGAIRRWRLSVDGTMVTIETENGLLAEVTVEDAEAGTDPFLFGLRTGMRAFGPLDVETDYRPAFRHLRRVIVPSRDVTPRTVVDLQTAAWLVDPSASLRVTESDEGDVHAEMT